MMNSLEIKITCNVHGPKLSPKGIPYLVNKEPGIWEVSLKDMYCDNFSACRDKWFIVVRGYDDGDSD